MDRRLASLWFWSTVGPIGWDIPSPWDSVADVYRSAARWIRLDTNVPAHRKAALAVLGVADDAPHRAGRETVAEEVATWSADDLESAVVAAGGCAATRRPTPAERLAGGGATTARLSLARTAQLLLGGPRTDPDTDVVNAADAREDDWEEDVENTVWGQARRLYSPVVVDGIDLRWERPASPLGSEQTLEWLDTP